VHQPCVGTADGAGAPPWSPPNDTRRLLDAFAGLLPTSTGRSATDQRLGQLTDREQQVLVEVARGRSNGEIAHLLTVHEATVRPTSGRSWLGWGGATGSRVVVVAYQAGINRPGTD
jgi:FixJ family two-component response regulator